MAQLRLVIIILTVYSNQYCSKDYLCRCNAIIKYIEKVLKLITALPDHKSEGKLNQV